MSLPGKSTAGLVATVASLAMLALLAAPVMAQLQSGSISGRIVDETGAALPGVTLTLKGVDASWTTVTDATGDYRFLNLAPGSYTLTAELPRFAKYVHEGIVIEIGRNAEIPIVLKISSLEDAITVGGQSPVVDVRNLMTATNFTRAELEKIPTSRDLFALLRTVPGVIIDRINIAGNETGQQSGCAGSGQAVWTMDGVIITDMAATGSSPTYFDWDAFEEIQVSSGAQDIRQPTGGLGLNLVVKRGTNQYRGNLKGYYTGEGSRGATCRTS